MAIGAGPGLAVALVASLLLSGCAGGSASPESAPSGSLVAPADFDLATGAIEGLVHDDSLVPIEGAQIALKDTDLITTSDASGRFAFSNLAPGEYQVFALRLGFDSVAKQVEVAAGQSTNLDLLLVPLPVTTPWSAILEQRGMFGCGASWRPQDPATGGGIAACGALSLYANDTTFDEFFLAWVLAGTRPDWKGAVFETVWQSNQVLGQGLWPLWEPLNCGVRFAQQEGRSPIRTRLGEVELMERFDAADKSSDDDCEDNCDEEKCEFQSRMFPSAQSLGPSYPADISIQIQQVYTNYLTAFYHDEGPVEFSAIADV